MGVFTRNARSNQAAAAANEVISSEQPSAAQRFSKGGRSVWHKIIGYNDTEANRIGVPYVSSKDWFAGIFTDPKRRTYEYFDALFPFTKWILSYNSQWLIGDLIAGITVGLVVVPQSLSYATIAMLSPEYGLYSSFVGVVIYVLFATSKDVTIGPVAVMSLQTANVIRAVQGRVGDQLYAPEVIASALAFICGVITLGIGLLRIGWIVEFIPAPAVSGFMTGSAFTIAVGQVPKLMGISGVTTNGPASYKIVIDTLKRLPSTTVDAAFGLGTLTFLYAVRWVCNYIPKRRPRYARLCFFISVFRSAFIIIILTAAVYGWLKPIRDAHPRNPKYPISIIKTVPPGFKHMGQPEITGQLLSDMAGEIPVSVIVLLLEHIAISKSFGRLNNYKINPNQELVAIGVTNLVGPTFGAYAATGSFSRSAIKAKSGVRTPLAGWITAIVVLVALYGVTGAFYWIPNAVLSAVIIHAVGDLMAPPSLLYRYWLVSPFEFFIFLAAVFVTVFTSVEIGVYVSVAASAALLLIRIARPRGQWLGRVRIHYGNSNSQSADDFAHRDVYVPLDDKDGLRDPSVRVDPPPPGVLIYRFEEAFTYPNASYLADNIIDRVKSETQPHRTLRYKRAGDRPWNDPGPINPYLVKFVRTVSCGLLGRSLQHKLDEGVKEATGDVNDDRPHLRALIFDCSSVSNVDTTSVQALADIRQAIERYVGAQVEFHFVSITSPWIRRALLAAGFGTGRASSHVTEVAPVVSQHDRIHQPLSTEQQRILHQRLRREKDLEAGSSENNVANRTLDVISEDTAASTKSSGATSEADVDYKHRRGTDEDEDPTAGAGGQSTVSVPVIWNHDLTPFFHLDISSALAAATGKGSID
jgi:sodium-independent sulfate anion transporter 11